MRTGLEKLAFDLKIMEAMAALMAAYAASDSLFWNVGAAGMPTLTLGGYFMRQHRLLALVDLLNGDEVMRLQTAVSTVSEAIAPQTVHFEQKANKEIFVRVRQFAEYLKDLQRERGDAVAGYKTAVEARAMIAALVQLLENKPYQLDNKAISQISMIDNSLRLQWRSGDFIWAAEWAQAYPLGTYWWLYGSPNL